MMSLMQRKLTQTQAGTRVEIGYGEDSRLSGVVTDNDGKEEIEILSDDGQYLIIRYSEVKIFRMMAADPSQPPAPAPPSLPALQPVRPDEPAFFLARVENLMPTDAQLRDWFKDLPKPEKKRITGKFDSFMSGIRQMDLNKCCQAVRQIRQELESDGTPDRQAAYLCGQMLIRCKQPDPLLFERCGALWEAAYLYAKGNQDMQRSGACAAAALMQPQTGEQLDRLLTLLLDACREQQDITAVQWLADQGSPVPFTHFDELIRVLLRDKDLPEQGERAARLSSLARSYPQTGMGELAASLGAQPDEQSQTQEEGTGEVVAVNLLLERGTLQYGDEQLTFYYSDVADHELETRLRRLERSDCLPEFLPVVFALTETRKPVQIRSDSALDGQSLLQYAQSNWPDKRDAAQRLAAEPYLTRAVQSAEADHALAELLAGSVVVFDSTGDLEPVRRAEALYRTHADRYTTRWWGVLPLANVYWKLREYDQALSHLEPAAANLTVYPRHRLSFFSQLTRVYLDRFQAKGNRNDLKKALQHCKNWEKLYQEEDELQQDVHVRNFYYNSELYLMAKCEMELGLLDDARQHIHQAAAENPLNPEILALRKEIRAALARQEAEQAAAQQAEQAPAAEPEPLPVPEEPCDTEDWPDRYTDESGWQALGMDKRTCIDIALGFEGEGRFPSMLAYLKAASVLHEPVVPVYGAVNLALDGPLDPPDYTPEALLTLLGHFDRDYDALHRCCFAAASLRAAFSARVSNTYVLNTLRDSVELFHTMPEMRELFERLAAFTQTTGDPVDTYADYRQADGKALAARMAELVQQAQTFYVQYIENPPRDSASMARLLETKKRIFHREGRLARMLRAIIDQDSAQIQDGRDRFVRDWIVAGKPVNAENISMQAIEDWIDEAWKQAGESLTTIHQNSRLVSARRNNLRSGIHNVIRAAASWYELFDRGAQAEQTDQSNRKIYEAARPEMLDRLTALRTRLSQAGGADRQTRVGFDLLIQTVDDLAARLDGTWNADSKKYFFIDLLHDDAVLLQEDYRPDLTSTFCALPDFNILARIRAHADSERLPFAQRIAEIYGQDRERCNFGTAALLTRYLTETGQTDALQAIPPSPEKYEAQAARRAEAAFRQFLENYALANSRGQIMLSDAFLTTAEDTIRYWYEQCRSTKNYGFFIRLTEQIYRKIHIAAGQYGDELSRQLDSLHSRNPELFENNDAEQDIRGQIAQQNFTVAEDWMNRLQRGEYRVDLAEIAVAGWLGEFWEEYGSNFNTVSNAGVSLKNVQTRSVHRKDIRGGQVLINSWIKGRGSRSETIQALLAQLGWIDLSVQQMHHPHISDDHYWVTTDHVAGRRNFPHPIAEFGSAIADNGIMVVCLYGSYSADGLLAKFRELDIARGSKLVLLDFALTEPERRKLARKMKEKESGLFGTYLLIDRVLIQFLARHYNATTINSMLLAVGMPFSYCQPYVADSTSAMPPEMFIGRKDELREIESPNGVNLIYGGRQLGKSALFQKARLDLDGNEGSRAILVDLSRNDCTKSARKLSTELVGLDILPTGSETEDWAVLAAAIKARLRAPELPQISYLLIMLDEADTFIESCKDLEYQPITELKDIQQSLPGRFKFVLAGLHNIVRFNRDVALGRNAVITHLSSLNVRPFDFTAASELLTGPLRYLGFVLEDQVLISQILATTNYFPGLIQLYCKKMIESMRVLDYADYNQTTTPPYVITDTHIKKVLSDSNFLAEIRDKFEITLRLDSYYYLIALLIGWLDSCKPSANGYRAAELLDKAAEWDLRALIGLTAEQIGALLEELRDLNILRATGAESYLFASKNFRDLLGTAQEIEDKLYEEGMR